MKFTIVVVVLALVVSASTSVVPLPLASSLGLLSPWATTSTSWGSPLGVPLLGNPWASPLALTNGLRIASIVPSQISLSQGIAGPLGLPLTRLAPAPIIAAPAPVIAAAPAQIIAAAPEASYVAANRGSVHVAPLPGHLQSVSSNNLEPAPGTL